MRVLVIGSSGRIGLGFHFVITAIAMKELGIDVIVVSPRKRQFDELPMMLKRKGIELFIVDNIDSINPIDVFKSSPALYKILRDIRPNIVIAEGIKQLSKTILNRALEPRNSTSYINITGSIPEQNTQMYLKLLDKFVDYTIALCNHTKRTLLMYGFNPNKIIVTPLFSPYLPIFDSLKNESVSLEKYGLECARKPIIFYTAYHHPWKGFEYYLLAARKVLKRYDATFVLGGTGPLTDRLKKMAERLGISKNVVFTGFIQLYDFYPMLYKVIDIAVSTSLREQFPSYILEVMAAGKPIVATKVGGVPEQVFDSFNGFLVEPRDYNAIADKISTLIDNDDLRKRMGLNGRRIIERLYNRELAIRTLIRALERSKIE